MKDADVQNSIARPAADLVIRRILVPTDLSPIADHALEFALELARRLRATVEVLTVLGRIEGDAFNPIRSSPEASAFQRTSSELVREALSDLIGRHNVSGVSVKSSVRRGVPMQTIVQTARRMQADLVIVGMHDQGRIQHFLAGNTAEALVRRLPSSVLILHEHDTRPPSEIRRILVPVDQSPVSEDLVRYAMALAHRFEATIDILHVVEPVPLLDTFTGAMTIRDMVPDMKQHSTAELKKLVDRVDREFPKDQVTVDEGHAAACILDRAKSGRFDLIVVGKRGRSAIERFFIGSVTERVVRHAPCAVLVVDPATVARQLGRSTLAASEASA